jgi:rhodanese-related sulfurtransferase
MAVSTIFAEELKQRLDAGDRLYLLDVRDEDEYELANIGGHSIPLDELPRRLNELDSKTEIVAVCKMGTRSAKAVELLKKAGFSQVLHLAGGIQAWAERIDRTLRRY